MSIDQRKDLIKSIKKIPLFLGLSPTQVRKLLAICTPRNCEPGEVVIGSDSPGQEMFILVSGELAVSTEDGVQVATVEPVTTVGEMAVIAKRGRSASVSAISSSKLFVVPKAKFDVLLRANTDIQVTVYRNIIEILTAKILTDNVRTRDYVLESARNEEALKGQAATSEVALDLLVEHAGMTREVAASRLAAEVEARFKRVLIVDDEPAFRQFARAALTTLAVLEAGDGERALEIVRDNPPDLVITDVAMSEMDGPTLLSRLREEHPDLPVLAISGFVSADDVREHDFDGFIQKPVTVEQFRRIVSDALALHDDS